MEASLDRLSNWASYGHKISVADSAAKIVEDVRENLAGGNDAEERPLTPLRDSTLEAPIRVKGGNKIPRKQY